MILRFEDVFFFVSLLVLTWSIFFFLTILPLIITNQIFPPYFSSFLNSIDIAIFANKNTTLITFLETPQFSSRIYIVIQETTLIYLKFAKEILFASVILTWGISILDDIGNLPQKFNKNTESVEHFDDTNPPPLDLGSSSIDYSESHSKLVFDPTFGIIPSDTKDLWKQQEQQRSKELAELKHKHQSYTKPPIRFGSHSLPSNEADNSFSDDDGPLSMDSPYRPPSISK